MEYGIRPAVPADQEQIYRLKAASVRPYVERIWGWDETYQRNDFERDFAVPEHFKVIEADGEFAGFLQYSCGAGWYEVIEMHLWPRFQGHGIGTRLLRSLQKDCADAGRKLRIGCFKDNQRAFVLYQRLGFRQAGETDTHYLLEYSGG